MKNLLITMLLLVITLSFCGCKKPIKESNNNQSDTSSATNINTSEENENVVAKMKELADANIYILKNITGFLYLPTEDTPINEHYYKVKSDKFKKVQDIKQYLSEVYVSSVCDMIMENLKDIYVDLDGELYIDERYKAGKGYFVNWDNYTLNVESLKENKCEFKLSATKEEPGEVTTATPYIVNVTAQKIDGVWLLTNVFY